MAQFYRAMDEPDEAPHCHPSHPAPGQVKGCPRHHTPSKHQLDWSGVAHVLTRGTKRRKGGKTRVSAILVRGRHPLKLSRAALQLSGKPRLRFVRVRG